ncbi:MAG: HNH endonuclease [Limosilactobacillus gorillae]|nr:HNH endonuclease [Limosilactobacillus gorillae]
MEITCMFCGQKKESSLEHVIPKAIGNNSFTTDDVCKDCNSALGATIDSKFIDNPLIKIIRNKLKLKGYKGNVPQVLRSGEDSNGNTIILDKDYSPKYITKVVERDNNFSVLTSSKEEAAKIFKKKLERKHVPQESIDEELKKIKNMEVEENRPQINFCFKYDMPDLELEFLKIAFEYMNKYYGDTYKQDPVRNRLKNILNQFKSGRTANYSNYVTDNVQNQLSTPIRNALKTYEHNVHVILPVVNPKNKKLYIYIFLFNGCLSYRVLVSNQGDTYPEILSMSKRKMIVIS